MALGQTYDNNKNEAYRPTVYGISMSNTGESAVDKTQLSFSMWKGTIKVQIAPMVKASSSDDFPKADRDSAASIYLSPSKAYMLSQIMRKCLDDIKAFPLDGYSINAGGGLITISSGKDFGAKNPCIVLRSINPDTGKVESMYAYEFKTDYHTVIENYNEEKGSYTENAKMFANIEMQQVIEQLEDYARSSNHAYAFSVCDSMSFQLNSVRSDIGKVAEKLGVTLGGKGGRKGTSRSFFNKGGNGGNASESVAHQTATIDDIVGNDD